MVSCSPGTDFKQRRRANYRQPSEEQTTKDRLYESRLTNFDQSWLARYIFILRQIYSFNTELKELV